MQVLRFRGSDSENLKAAINIRIEVFMNEQSVSFFDEFDDKDKSSDYVLVMNETEALGCGRVYFENNTAHLGRIAVVKKARKNGIGRIIIEELISISKEHGADEIVLGAQVQAVGFYEKLGYKPYGDIYSDANIEHINMKLK